MVVLRVLPIEAREVGCHAADVVVGVLKDWWVGMGDGCVGHAFLV